MSTTNKWQCPECSLWNTNQVRCQACFTELVNDSIAADFNSMKIDMNDDNDNTDTQKPYEFTICSFNIWCPYYNHTDNYSEQKNPKLWMARNHRILQFLADSESNGVNADIYCLQEYWCDHNGFTQIYQQFLNTRNYSIYYLSRSSMYKPDGVAILYKNDKFKLLNRINVGYHPGDRVAMMLELQHLESDCIISVGNTHLSFAKHWNAEHRNMECLQYLDMMNQNTSKHASAMIICGDFNCDVDGAEYALCLEDGYRSTFEKDEKCSVSHLTHDGRQLIADYIMYQNNQWNKKVKQKIEPIQCCLLPQHLDTKKWPTKEQWDLSDHRPLLTTFAILQK